MDDSYREIMHAVTQRGRLDDKLLREIASRLPVTNSNRLALRQVSSNFRNVARPHAPPVHDVRVDACSIGGVAQQGMTGRIMSANELMSYVQGAIANREHLQIVVGYVHPGMRLRLPGRRAIDIQTFFNRGTFLSVKFNHRDHMATRYFEQASALYLENVDYQTPFWRFWLLWLMGTMRTSVYPPRPNNYRASAEGTTAQSPGFLSDVMAIVRRRFPQATTM